MLIAIRAEKHAVEGRGAGAEPLRGRVHSVFRHAVNFEMQTQRLVTLTLLPKPLSPQGIVVSREAFRDSAGQAPSSFLNPRGLLPFDVGEPIRLSAETLVSSRFVIDLTAGVAVDLRVRSCAVRGKIAEVLDRWLAETLLERSLVAGLRGETLFGSGRIAELGEAIAELFFCDGDDRRTQIDRLGRSLERFVGLGEGLTPSGDDFIVGLLWSMATDKRLSTALLPIMRRALIPRTTRTNFISGQMLRYAGEAQFTEPLVRLARADERTRLCAVFEDIAAFGHTSGLDTLCGLLSGLKISAPLINSFQKSAPTASNGIKAADAA